MVQKMYNSYKIILGTRLDCDESWVHLFSHVLPFFFFFDSAATFD